MRKDEFNYPIKILSFYSDENNNFKIKYQYCNKRVAGTIGLDDFLNSPLIYGTHPAQIFYLGYDTCNFLHAIENSSRQKPDAGRRAGLRGFLYMDKKYYDPDSVPLEFKYYQWIVGVFILFSIMTNLLAVKECKTFMFTYLAGSISSPFSYAICDIVTEVYGFQRSRQLIYFGIICSYFFLFCIKIADALPAANSWHLQDAFHDVLNSSMPRIIIASTIGTIIGNFVNCKLISTLKIKINKLMFFRFVSATAVGTLVDNMTFIGLAFVGVKPLSWLLVLLMNQYAINLMHSALISPLCVRISVFLKRMEKSDIYDLFTNFSPFSIRVTYTKNDNYYGKKE